MDLEGYWRVALNHPDGNRTRLMFSSNKPPSLIDITVDSCNTAGIIDTVLGRSWNRRELLSFLNAEVKENRLGWS